MKKFSGYFLIIAFLFFLSLGFYAIDEIFIERTLPEAKKIEIEKGESADSVVDRLYQEDLIRNKSIAKAYLVLSGLHKEIKPGLYSIGPVYSIKYIFDEFAKGNSAEVRIFEGMSVKEIAKILEERKLIDGAGELEKLALNFNNSLGRYEFLPNKRSINLEGYLFPDTYKFEKSSAQEFIQTMLNNFEKRVYSQFSYLNVDDLNEVIVMASMLEKEVQTEEDMKLVSGILWKRLQSEAPLQVDATLVYIKCFILNQSNCRFLNNDDRKIESLYNTYLHKGLPPGSISNPGLTAIRSALRPENSPYWYYLSARDDGRTIFSRTLEEHNLNRSVYR